MVESLLIYLTFIFVSVYLVFTNGTQLSQNHKLVSVVDSKFAIARPNKQTKSNFSNEFRVKFGPLLLVGPYKFGPKR